jgi:hypothetical protein
MFKFIADPNSGENGSLNSPSPMVSSGAKEA